MKYYFSLLYVLLFLAGIKLDACCWRSKSDDVDDLARRDSLTKRKYSFSTNSSSSDERFSEQSNPSFLKNRKESFSIFTVCDGNFSQDVIGTTKEILLCQHKFNEESAACFIWLKNCLMNNFDYEGPLEKTRDIRQHALKYLNERGDFFPQDYLEDSKINLVYALQVLFQKRYALLNYCMRIVLDDSLATSEFFLYFPDKISITQKFPECLANFVASNPTTKMPQTLKDRLSRANTWITITAAFGSYPTKKSYSERFCKMLTRVRD